MGTERAGARRRRKLAVEAAEAFRDLNLRLALLNRRFGGRVELRDVDWTCLDLVNRHGPMTPTTLARLAGVHPATLTGVLDRLQKGGWIVRERDPESADRRAVTLRAVRERNAVLFELFSGMNERMSALYSGYSDAELETIADFLRRAGGAAQEAADELR
ncbi:MarR family transcriptional regulator [Nocardia otitidiscaviarum]|uniref:MarR family transcriptional regulator n=1 Tax=Nocardia otitidiscaviarum TaxID=1823 RepID=UPI0004A77AA7|nr:MarR family transcriptional regulator [Nocardia otitidiscaviarum]MBF6131676.1 MarR family transcriptional regulator [Nocardia otitidiscaviarum]MBF6482808.1 MarR family transcriptional regulator [Nocardia otitidiscaviarum]